MRKGEQKRQQIIKAAAQLFYQKGYDATTVQDILDSLNTSKGSFYHHFDAKVDVLTELARQTALESKQAYQALSFVDAADAFNQLLRYASPFKQSDLALLRSLEGMQSSSERAILWDAMARSSSAAFFGEFASLLWTLQQLGQAVWRGEDSLRLAFESFFGACKLLAELPLQGPVTASLQAVPLLLALRRQTERQLGLRAGSVVILNATDLQSLLAAVMTDTA